LLLNITSLLYNIPWTTRMKREKAACGFAQPVYYEKLSGVDKAAQKAVVA
jgi:hypothetical protein